MLQAVVFDLGNTLITCRPWFRIELETLVSATLLELACQGRLQIADSLLVEADRLFAEIHTHSRTLDRELSAAEIVNQVLARLPVGDLSPPAVDQALDAVYRACVPEVTPCAGAAETLDHLRAAGYRLAVFSNARYAPFVHWALDHAGLTSYLHLAESSHGIGWRKPGAAAFQFVLDQLGLAAHQAVYVGDYYPFDIVGAKAVGMGTIWLERAYSPTGPAADAIVTALPEIIPVLQRWQERDAA